MKPLFLLPLALGFFSSTICPANTTSNAERPVTIMPLGDSITEGGEGIFVYRYPLMGKLRAAGFNVVYVGSRTTHPVANSPLGVLPHEGYGGQNIGFLRAHFEALYRKNPADIILIHAGHNHSYDEQPVAGMVEDTRAIIVMARAINPKVTVLLAQVITSGKLPKYSYIPAFNQALTGLAKELNTPTQPVILVNQAEGFDWRTDTISDHVHPNAQGAEKMAVHWFDALRKVLPMPVKEKTVSLALAGNPLVPQSLRLWPGPAPGLVADPGPEVADAAGRVSNVSVPMLDVYLPAPERANGIAIIICSGGGYTRLASGPLGRGAAEIFCPLGYAVCSLKYRLTPPSKNVLVDALVDARQAVRLVRSHADEWRLDPHRIGMVGFSAGSNLILNLATTPDVISPQSGDPLARLSSRPDFIGLAATWPYKQGISSFVITSKAPPAFIVHARDDTTAPFHFAEEIAGAWRRAGVPVAFHSYEKGGHMGFNFPRPPVGDWTAQFTDWLNALIKERKLPESVSG
ncbi:MAG TPA: GDSL-type esterase/lipase family protein [Rariglobus sp.]|jgi:acetyl esterase/lipase|nr:GDSL-type esterase/lipase family protein [Rariglobus sp.]